jgi:hypothetical protein
VAIVNQQRDDNCKPHHKNSHHTVFLFEESHRSFSNGTMDRPQLCTFFLVQPQINWNPGNFFHIEKGNAQSKQGQQNNY